MSSIVLGRRICWIDWFMSVATVPENIICLRMGISVWRDHCGIQLDLQDRCLCQDDGSCRKLCYSARQSRSRASTEALDNGKRSDMAVAVSVSLGCLIYLLSSRLSWTHNFMLATPMILIGFRPFDSH